MAMNAVPYFKPISCHGLPRAVRHPDQSHLAGRQRACAKAVQIDHLDRVVNARRSM